VDLVSAVLLYSEGQFLHIDPIEVVFMKGDGSGRERLAFLFQSVPPGLPPTPLAHQYAFTIQQLPLLLYIFCSSFAGLHENICKILR
jgi:hypothetical protein